MTQTTIAPTIAIDTDEDEYVMTWAEDKDWFIQGVGEILADPSYSDEGFDELLANYMEDGTELDWETITKAAQTCYYNIFDEVNRRLEPTAEMLEVNGVIGDEYIEAFDEELCLHLDIHATWKRTGL